MGISIEDRPNLFVPYFKSKDKMKNGYETHGLGLSISKRIAKGLGGDLTYSDEMMEGSIFILTLRL